jgi:hypothetical protein
MGLDISLEVDLESDDPYRDRALQILLWMLIHLDILYLQRFPHTPRLYDSGVRYKREPWGYEQWITIPSIIRQGGADCEDLAAWRVAELRTKGINARPMWRYHEGTGPNGKPFRMYHILVWTPYGIDDPSARLGMRGRA